MIHSELQRILRRLDAMAEDTHGAIFSSVLFLLMAFKSVR